MQNLLSALAVKTPKWQQYELLDSGAFEKLECFGDYALIRPEPQAVWPRTLPEKKWREIAAARFEQQSNNRGVWERYSPVPENWSVYYQSAQMKLDFQLALTNFKHVGLFPEQAANWEYIYDQCRKLEKPAVLNLFAYTGGATLAAAAADAEVAHVDAIKQVVSWAKRNGETNGVANARWLVDDAVKFVKREIRRGSVYQGIILDPPAFGHGPKGERWILEQEIRGLVHSLRQLLAPPPHFWVFNAYSMGFSPLILAGLLQSAFKSSLLENLELGELALKEKHAGRLLPAGVFARFFNDAA